jgi:hypothetical protein
MESTIPTRKELRSTTTRRLSNSSSGTSNSETSSECSDPGSGSSDEEQFLVTSAESKESKVDPDFLSDLKDLDSKYEV